MCIVEIDEKGRITLPNELRKILKLGKVLLVNAGDHIILLSQSQIIHYRS